MAAPLNNKEAAKQYASRSASSGGQSQDPKTVSINLLDVVIDDKFEPKLIREGGRVKVVVEAESNGVKTQPPVPEPRVIMIDDSPTSRDAADSEFAPYRPKGTLASFRPTKSSNKASAGGSASVIFGQDDRFEFEDNSYPWGCVGRVQHATGSGSGCMIGPHHMLTASHCVNWLADGKPGWLQFSPGYHNGPGPWGTFNVTLIYSYRKNPVSMTDRQVAFDYVVCILDQRIGDTIGWAGFREFSVSWVKTISNWSLVGYPADLTGTQRPIYQGSITVTSKEDYTEGGHTGSLLGNFSDITPGMSGGPLMNNWDGEVGPRVVGVCSIRAGPPILNPTGSTKEDNDHAGGAALIDLISEAFKGNP